MQSSIYVGQVRHQRFEPAINRFGYSLYMMALDVDEVSQPNFKLGILGTRWYYPLRFNQKDYVKSDNKHDPATLKQRIVNKVESLLLNNSAGVVKSEAVVEQTNSVQTSPTADIDKVIMLAQVRCFGLYFSPANFYFCYDAQGEVSLMLIEVSNTPWNQRHYYLINLKDPSEAALTTKKVFHVSPFMDLDMSYIWNVKPPSLVKNNKNLLIHIENHKLKQNSNTNSETELSSKHSTKVFDATLSLKKRLMSKTQLLKVLMGFPVMTLKIVMLIYWQALKLFAKRVPFVSYQSHKD